ncbi:MAG: DNA mismatch repair protein MutS [Candidatus Omnitrophota bacterium]
MITRNTPPTKLTPMMSQYLTIKQDNQDSILFFRLGDFYEMFLNDAEIASKILGLALTSREAGKGRKVPMCGVPFHAADNYISRLIKSGRKVAICEQTEDPRLAKGIVKREIVRVVTPGTVLSPALLEENTSNFIVAVNKQEQKWGLGFVELSTGEFKVTEISSFNALDDELVRIAPAEIILPDDFKKEEKITAKIKERLPALVTFVEPWDFDCLHGVEVLKNHFATKTIEGFGLEDLPIAVGCAAALVKYLALTQKTTLSHITTLGTYNPSDFMMLDASTQTNLELIKTTDGKIGSGTLFHVLNKTKTAMGARLLKAWILQPLKSIPEINRRLEATEELSNNNSLRERLEEILIPCLDIARLAGRVSLKIANARDILALKQSLDIIPVLKQYLADCQSELPSDISRRLDPLDELRDLIRRAIAEEPPLSVRDGNLIKAGFNPEVDELHNILTKGKDWVLSLQEAEKKRTNITSLKIRYNKVFGYYIEITKANLHLVPADYIRKQTLTNAERFITPQLQEYETKILGAQERIVTLEYEVFMQVLNEVVVYIERVKNSASFIATVDVILSFAITAKANAYVKPQISETDVIDIKEGCHPVLQEILPEGQLIANDLYLDREETQILVITGPNMAGKSTYIRQAALLILMAQIGSFLPAKQARIGVVDRIFSRIGAADMLTAGMSTFMVEMIQSANILNNATSRSLIILDEIGRGTSTFDGLSIAWAVVEYLHNNPSASAKTLFATHYHELTEANIMLKRVKNFNVAVKEWQDEVVFLYKITPGSCDHSFGIHVAKLAGLPPAVINRAKEILRNLEMQSIAFNGQPSFATNKKRTRKKEEQLDLFSPKPVPFYRELQNLEIDTLTPIEALNLLNKFKKEVEANG